MSRSILTVPVQKIDGDTSTPFQDLLAVEEPLEIRLGERAISITMRTPGHDAELAAGFLLSESILESAGQIREIQASKNQVRVDLNSEVEIDFARLQRHFYTTSSCGVCGKASIEALRANGCPSLAREVPKVAAAVLHALPEALRRQQTVFEHTGALHAAALFDAGGRLILLREDVGRHNAVDKVIGAQLLAGLTPLPDKLLLVSGRASFELTQKALMAGIPILVAVGAPSSLAVETAQRFNLTLVGFVRNGRFNIYSGGQRIQP